MFALLADPSRVVGCLPGASLDPGAADGELHEGQELGGRIAVRIGPVGTELRGVVRVLELDREALRSVLGVRAEDERGNGSASATVALSVEAADGGSEVHLASDVEVRGRIATFGGGAVERVSARLVDRFAANLAQAVTGGGPPPPRPERTRSTPELRMPSGSAWPALATFWAFAAGVLLGRAARR